MSSGFERKANYRYTQEHCEIIEKKRIGRSIFDFVLSAPAVAKVAKIGQFVNIICGDKMLRRPISLCGFNSESDLKGTIRIVFEIRGEGTDWLSKREVGEKLDVVGPLGRGFPLFEKDKKVILVGGGIGTPPLLPLANFYGSNAVAINGFRSTDCVILENDFKNNSTEMLVCTDDGSCGIKGFTTQALKKLLSSVSDGKKYDYIYTCGPKIMMKLVADIASEYGVRCFVSMEERMACGVGVCFGCTCEIKGKDGAETEMKRVCVNGPVFESTEVIW